MLATPVRLEWVIGPPLKSNNQSWTRLLLHVMVDGQPLVINIGNQLRPLVGVLRPNRRDALVATLPKTLDLTIHQNFRGTKYLVDRSALQFWAEDALDWLAANRTGETATQE